MADERENLGKDKAKCDNERQVRWRGTGLEGYDVM